MAKGQINIALIALFKPSLLKERRLDDLDSFIV